MQARGGVSRIETQEAMQVAVHTLHEYGHLPTVDAWTEILQREENRTIKNSLLDSVGRHSDWFFGDKLEAVAAALTGILSHTRTRT